MPNKDWVFQEELNKSPRLLNKICRMLHRKYPNTNVPIFVQQDEIISATRFWGYRVKGCLTAVMDKNEQKTLSFLRDWHGAEVPLHIKPLVNVEGDPVVISPVAETGFDFSKLSASLKGLYNGKSIENALVNFFHWAAESLSKEGAIKGFVGNITIDRYKIADRVLYRHNGDNYEIWANCDTDEVWEAVPEIGVCEKVSSQWKSLTLFLLPYLGCTAMLWWLSMKKNLVMCPPITPEIRFGFMGVMAVLLIGIFLRGFVGKIVGAIGVISCSIILAPWIGESWDVTTELLMLSPFLSGELAEAPIASVYIVGVIMLTLCAALAVPSLAIKIFNGRIRIIMAILLAMATSPWPIAIAAMPEISAQFFRWGVIAFGFVCICIVGHSGWAFSAIPKRNSGADKIIIRILKFSKPSICVMILFVIAILVLFVNQISLMGGVQ
jgi:hypothetical protein